MKHVLLVDDSEQIRERLAVLLAESEQIRIVGQAGNRKEAMEVLRRRAPDTVILDIRLPGGSGIELLREIKARYPNVAVIMLTNYDYDKYRQQCKQLGADYFLNKTLEFEKIIDSIMGKASR
jgi:DNA-binding NarL/FixJ family response regulator